jgi:DNA-binding transcriptional ArsR family regulator
METYSAPLPDVFGALADPTRLAVVERLFKGAASVSELSRPFRIARPSFLKHLGVLERAGVVRSEKVGRVRTVHLAPEVLDAVEHWLRGHRALMEGRLDRLATFLDEEEKR